jgi:hypothetical protein
MNTQSDHLIPEPRMKRHMDLTRKILLVLEEDETAIGGNRGYLPGIPNYTEEQIEYHVRLASEDGLIKTIGGEDDGFGILATRLTSSGHNFLEAARDDTRWNRAKELARLAGGLTVKTLTDILLSLGETVLKQYLPGGSPSGS